MEYLYTDIEKNIIEKLKNSRPIRIWTEYVKVVFEFEYTYIELECVPEIADSQNGPDEAITTKVREFYKVFKPQGHSTIIIKDSLITDIKIVQTLLYFTDSITEPEKVKKINSQWDKMLSIIAGVRKSKIEKILEGTSSSYHSEVICNPDAEEIKDVPQEYSNIIDVGLLLKIENSFLPAFVRGNGYGFPHLETKPFLNLEDLKKDQIQYRLY